MQAMQSVISLGPRDLESHNTDQDEIKKDLEVENQQQKVKKAPLAQSHPDRRYKCSFCARAFSRSEHKNRHERSHTKERPFKCDRCKSTFVRRDLLLRHVRTVHAKAPVPTIPPIVTITTAIEPVAHEEHSRIEQDQTELSAAMLMTRLGTVWNDDSFEDSSSSDSSQSSSLRKLLRETLVSLDPSGNLLRDTALPTHRDLSYHLTTYINSHHPFYPFIHLPTFSPANTPRPLLLAILSLGALPSNKELASRLHVASKMMVNSRIDTDGFSSRSAPLWVTQTVLLNTAFAAWSGDPRGLEFACSVKSFLANLASGVRHELLRRSPKPPITNSASEDDEWIKLEAMRRTYFAVYVFFAELTAFFNFPPTIPNSEPGVVMLPCDEEVWNGTTPLPPAPSVVFKIGLEYVLKGQHMRCSSFAKRVLATGMFIESWVARSGGLLFAARTDQLDGMLASFARVIHADIMGCLNRVSESTWKLARMRVVGVDLSPVQESLRCHDVSEIVHAVRTCASRIGRTGDALVVAAEVAIDALFGPQEDAAGGIEDVIVEWECALYLMMWVRRVERDMSVISGEAGLFIHAPDERELDVLQRLRVVQEHELHAAPEDVVGGEDRLSVFIGWWWARNGAKDVTGGWGIRSVLREAIGVYAEIVRRELVS